ncbi:hypothetical protein [Kordia sp.]|uniref:hypothetical protein n=1 Tax=Kordia sp. TaxID=1965332 RepID=UPI003B592BEA
MLHAQKQITPAKLFQPNDFHWNETSFKGPIQKATTRNYGYTFNKADSTYTEYTASNHEKDVFIDNDQIEEFDKKGRVVKFFYLEQDGTTFLEEENMYNRKGLYHNTKRDEVRKKVNGKSVTKIHEIHESRMYTIYGSLKEVWVKSSFQDDYFIKERYFYSDANVLLKKELYNSNVRTEYYLTCKGSSVDTDYVYLYAYDDQNRLTEKKIYAYEYNFDEDYYKVVNYRNFSDYTLHTVINYEYNNKNLIVKEVRKNLGGYLIGVVNTITRKYDHKDRLIEDMATYTAGHGNGHMYEYYEENGELVRVVGIYTSKKNGVKNLLKRINYITGKVDDHFVRYDYSNGNLVEIEKYNLYGDQIASKNIRDYESHEFVYTYDMYGNWTSRILLEKGIKKEKIVRELEYFEE